MRVAVLHNKVSPEAAPDEQDVLVQVQRNLLIDQQLLS